MGEKRRKRYDKNLVVSTEGYIKKYFGSDIGRILMPSSRCLQNCEIPYVSHPEAENRLKDFLEGDFLKDKSLVFTGLTGSGKTTILRHVFGLEENANISVIQGNTLIIPVDFNRSQSSAQDAILSGLRSAIQNIVDTYEIDYPDVENQRFYEYISKRRKDSLFLNPKHTSSTSYKERMYTFLEKMPVAFASFQLQYSMDQEKCKLKLVVLIVDNIEAFTDSNAKDSKRCLEPVISAFKLADCIDQRGGVTKWCFNMIIACRHHIWRIIKGEYLDNSEENPLLQSYVTTEKPYDLANPVKINSIIKEREEVFSRKQRDVQKWNEAVKVVNTVLQTMENSIGDFILQLVLKDFRKSMSKMQELILHRGLQKKSDEEIMGAFQIDSVEQFDLTRVNLIKVIGLGDKKYYTDSNSILPNLLVNSREAGMELYTLLTLKYFLIKCDFSEPAWDTPISITAFKEKMITIFQPVDMVLDGRFEQAIRYLIQHRLLLRSADQSQSEVPGLSTEEIKKIEYVYVSGAAVKLWEELGKSSALFQLFLDDIWLDENLDYFGDNGNDIEHCVKYLKVLQQIEQEIYNRAQNISQNAVKEYVKAFGSTPLCKQLLNGLIASLETICTSDYMRSQGRIDMAKETLKQANILSAQLNKWERDRKKYEKL